MYSQTKLKEEESMTSANNSSSFPGLALVTNFSSSLLHMVAIDFFVANYIPNFNALVVLEAIGVLLLYLRDPPIATTISLHIYTHYIE